LEAAVEAAVVLVIDGDRLLMLKTAAGRIGEGRWKSLSGKLMPGESPAEGAAREAFEESASRCRPCPPSPLRSPCRPSCRF
jgi:8-oxo-dGTP pyrophosphatase MutT (NUDIX family)